jgi:1-deoxy-D-xylulose-5-phosphate synthase
MPSSEIQSPLDLKKLQLEELERYAEDLRQQILTTSLTNGGHLGASLGAVELAIALHFVFDSPKDSLVWDVGHQAYAHKLITGRSERFSTLRKKAGISGFLSREESEHDAFGAGHSSTSISAALAMAWANGQKEDAPWSIAVIGDGAITAGLSFEALNNVRAKPIGPFVVVLNDNQMSISANVSSLSLDLIISDQWMGTISRV